MISAIQQPPPSGGALLRDAGHMLDRVTLLADFHHGKRLAPRLRRKRVILSLLTSWRLVIGRFGTKDGAGIVLNAAACTSNHAFFGPAISPMPLHSPQSVSASRYPRPSHFMHLILPATTRPPTKLAAITIAQQIGIVSAND